MAMYVYSTGGEPVGFLFGSFVHDLDGTPLGRVIGSRVHRLDGRYVGEWLQGTIVAKPGLSRTDVAPVATPPRQPSPGATFSRRVVLDRGYADRFGVLREGPDPMGIAAE